MGLAPLRIATDTGPPAGVARSVTISCEEGDMSNKGIDSPATESGAESGKHGFVLPVAIFALVLMGTMAVVALTTSRDEFLSSRAMRHSSAAFYAAEAGLHELVATWDSTRQAQVDALGQGDSLVLGWRTLDNGASYRGTLYRWDDGSGQPLYQLSVEGRGAGARGGQRVLSLSLTQPPGDEGEEYKLGRCCPAPAVLKGSFEQYSRGGGNVFHSGYDVHPPGWAEAGVCSDSFYDRPGIIMQDTSGIDLDPPETVLEGVPPIMQDDQMGDSVWEYFGEHTWQDVKDRADIIIDTTGYVYMADGSNPKRVDSSYPGTGIEGDEVYPRYTIDPVTGDIICDTSHPLNWGSPDPNDPCFNHFPVILARGEIDLRGGPAYGGDPFYGQGIFILDFNEAAGTGSEFEIEHEAGLRGVVLGRGCVAIQYGAKFYGSVFLNSTYDYATCDQSSDLYEDCRADSASTSHPCMSTTRIQFSQCAVDRAIRNSGLADYAEPQVPAAPGAVRPLGARAFGEGIR